MVITSITMRGVDPRGVRYQVSVTRSGDAWLIDTETRPMGRYIGSMDAAIRIATAELETACRSGAKPALSGTEVT